MSALLPINLATADDKNPVVKAE
ncbi:hypothetical protein A2U01_0113520, partial [Trifolium medium]|nr:hypothetical protein [Trifolium medium]